MRAFGVLLIITGAIIGYEMGIKGLSWQALGQKVTSVMKGQKTLQQA